MSMLNHTDKDELRPLLDHTVKTFLGFSEPTLSTAALKCIDSGYDRTKTIAKLSAILDEDKASNFTDRLFNVFEDFKHQKKPRRRKKYEEQNDDSNPKKRKFTDNTDVSDTDILSNEPLSSDKINEMMQEAQRMITERRTQLGVPSPAVQISKIQKKAQAMSDAFLKAQRAVQLQTSIQHRMATLGLPMPETLPRPVSGIQPIPLMLDQEGRTIDIKTGQAVLLQHNTPTLKANIRAKKREEFRGITEKVSEELPDSKYMDHRINNKAAQRPKRGFKFNERGKYIQVAQRLRTKAQLDKLQASISRAARRTGIASAAKLATVSAHKQLEEDEVPGMEWWDAYITMADTYDSVEDMDQSQLSGVTNLIEHPLQMACPSDTKGAVSIPVYLTKAERKKLRRQSRQENQKEQTEKIRLGLQQPPEPKVRLANLMRVLGTEAVQDPTRVEAHVRAQMAKRQRGHEEANAARKLTVEQRRDKKLKKIEEDTTLGVHVAVFRIQSLKNPTIKFKIETNAKQLLMTGIVVLFKDCNVVVAEGGPKQQRKFHRLMLHRIKWAAEKMGKDEGDKDKPSKPNSCELVWEGTAKMRAFSEVKFKQCPTESFAREQFKQHSVEHYWDLAYSSATLDSADT